MLDNIKSLVVRERNKLLPVVELLKVHKDHEHEPKPLPGSVTSLCLHLQERG